MSYEELMELGDKMGSVSKGFTEAEIKKIPKKRLFKIVDESGDHKR